MTVHRFREQLRATQLTPAFAGSADCAFVPCPMFASMPAAQQLQVQEIYRIAAERTREQLQPRRSLLPAFSLN